MQMIRRFNSDESQAKIFDTKTLDTVLHHVASQRRGRESSFCEQRHESERNDNQTPVIFLDSTTTDISAKDSDYGISDRQLNECRAAVEQTVQVFERLLTTVQTGMVGTDS